MVAMERAQVEPWFRAFARDHIARHPNPRWPLGKPSRPFWSAWIDAFVDSDINLELAEEASKRMMVELAREPEDHLERLIQLAYAVRRGRPRAGSPSPTPTPECPECDGLGQATRLRRKSGWPGGDRLYLTLWCVCPPGRARMQAAREADPQGPTLPDLADFPSLLLHPAAEEPAAPAEETLSF